MYSSDTGTSSKQMTGQQIGNWQKDTRYYWCGEPGQKFNCPKFEIGDPRTAGHNGKGKWKGKKPSTGKKTIHVCGISEKKGHKHKHFSKWLRWLINNPQIGNPVRLKRRRKSWVCHQSVVRKSEILVTTIVETIFIS